MHCATLCAITHWKCSPTTRRFLSSTTQNIGFARDPTCRAHGHGFINRGLYGGCEHLEIGQFHIGPVVQARGPLGCSTTGDAGRALGKILCDLGGGAPNELLLDPMIAGPEGGPSSDMQRYEG
jgi:hypothetical protein